MNVMRAEILQTVLGEIGKHNEGDKYLSAGRDYCAEFVSWVYKQAGYPLTGGSYSSKLENPPDSGDWMHRSTSRLIQCFTHLDYFPRMHLSEYDPSSWFEFKPQCGDFVYIGRHGSDRMHSGIVWYVENDGTLFTIEGNNAGRPVDTYCYPNYLLNKTRNGPANGIVMGIGSMDGMD